MDVICLESYSSLNVMQVFPVSVNWFHNQNGVYACWKSLELLEEEDMGRGLVQKVQKMATQSDTPICKIRYPFDIPSATIGLQDTHRGTGS